MKALMGYNYTTAKWDLFAVTSEEQFIITPSKLLNEKGNYLYPSWCITFKNKCIGCNTWVISTTEDNKRNKGMFIDVCVVYGDVGRPPFIKFSSHLTHFNEPLIGKVWYCEHCKDLYEIHPSNV